jgi:hypothetical protein
MSELWHPGVPVPDASTVAPLPEVRFAVWTRQESRP